MGTIGFSIAWHTFPLLVGVYFLYHCSLVDFLVSFLALEFDPFWLGTRISDAIDYYVLL